MRITFSTEPLYDHNQVEEMFDLVHTLEFRVNVLKNEDYCGDGAGPFMGSEARKKAAVWGYENEDRHHAKEIGLLDFLFGRVLCSRVEEEIEKYNSTKEDNASHPS